jgi:hypothetical protein
VSFYTPGHPATFTPSTPVAQNQFFYWPGYRETRREGESALYITRHDDVPPILLEQFAKVSRVDVFTPHFAGRPLQPFYIFLCEQFRPGVDKWISSAPPPG